MYVFGTVKLALKRGALVTAANWPIVLVQFAADTLLKALLAVPIVGGAIQVVLLAGGEPADLLGLDAGRMLSALVGVLRAQPLALASFLIAIGLVMASGSVLMFAVKAGSVSVLVAADRRAGPIEHPPLRWDAIGQAAAWSIETFVAGVRQLFGRYLQLGIVLAAIYVLLAGAYAGVVLRSPGSSTLDWSLVTLVASLALVLIFTAVNFLYVLTQVAIAAEDCSVARAALRVVRLLGRRGVEAVGVLASVFVLMLLSTTAAILATAAFGLIAFVPFVGLAALPLQICAWLVRGLVLEYVALTGVGAYLRLHALAASEAPARATGHGVTAAGRHGPHAASRKP